VPCTEDVIAMKPSVQAAVVHVIIHEELRVRARKAAQQLDNVVVPDVAQDASLGLKLMLHQLVQRPKASYLLHGHHPDAPVVPVGVCDAVNLP